MDVFTCILLCTLFLRSVTFCIHLFFVLLTGLPLNAKGLLYHLLSVHFSSVGLTCVHVGLTSFLLVLNFL